MPPRASASGADLPSIRRAPVKGIGRCGFVFILVLLADVPMMAGVHRSRFFNLSTRSAIFMSAFADRSGLFVSVLSSARFLSVRVARERQSASADPPGYAERPKSVARARSRLRRAHARLHAGLDAHASSRPAPGLSCHEGDARGSVATRQPSLPIRHGRATPDAFSARASGSSRGRSRHEPVNT